MAFEHDREEWRSAVATLDPIERTVNCGHSLRSRSGTCPDCGDDEPRGDLYG